MSDKLTLTDLGWSAFFMSQLEIEEIEASTMARVAGVHRNRVSVFTTDANLDLVTPVGTSTGDIAVGDWVLANWALKNFDRDSDIRLSDEEASAAASALRKIADADEDGRVTPAEFQAARAFILARY